MGTLLRCDEGNNDVTVTITRYANQHLLPRVSFLAAKIAYHCQGGITNGNDAWW